MICFALRYSIDFSFIEMGIDRIELRQKIKMTKQKFLSMNLKNAKRTYDQAHVKRAKVRAHTPAATKEVYFSHRQ